MFLPRYQKEDVLIANVKHLAIPEATPLFKTQYTQYAMYTQYAAWAIKKQVTLLNLPFLTSLNLS